MKTNLYALRPLAVILISANLLLLSACRKGHLHDTDHPAGGSLQNEEGNCSPGTAHGSWIAGLKPNADSSYVDVTLHVTSPGNYRIFSDSINGVQFADSGVFTRTGDQTVHLKPKGIFVMAKPTSFRISFDNSSCGFNVNVDSLPPLTSNRWRFTANGHLYEGNAEGHIWFLPNQLGTILEFNEEVQNSTDTVLVLEIGLPFDYSNITLGTYPGSVFYVYAGPTIFLYGMPTYDPRAKITVTLTGAIYPPPQNTRQIIGTFEGTAVDSRTKEVVPITNGQFHTGA